MNVDRQLRQRAEELRRLLKKTMRQTNDAIVTTMMLTDEIARRRERESLDRNFSQTVENVRSSQEKLDAIRLK